MTVAALPAIAEYFEDGVTTAFAAPFRFKATTDLLVDRIIAGTSVPLTIGTDYTVTGGATDAGGTVICTVASVGATLRIRRKTARTQPMIYTTGDRFPAASHEEALDRQMLIAQEQDATQADTASRAILLPVGEIAPVLAPLATRIGGVSKILGINETTGAIEVQPIDSAYKGNTGPANSTYTTLAALKAAPASNASYTLAPLGGARQDYTYVAGNFAALINDLDFVALNSVPATTGALVSKRSDRSTFARFGALGDGITDDTTAVQNAFNWASATKMPIYAIGLLGNQFSVVRITKGTTTTVQGEHKRGAALVARATAAPAAGTYQGLLEIARGTVIECRISDLRLDGNNAVNPWQIGFYAFAQPPSDFTAYQNGGNWYSTYERLDIAGFKGHEVWFRGGSNDTDANGNPIVGQYSFLKPHQFINFYDCHWIRSGVGGTLNNSLCMTGQCGQFAFLGCSPDGGDGVGTNISIGREFVGGGRDQGTALFAGGFVAPGFIQMRSLTSQGELHAFVVDNVGNLRIQGYFENLKQCITLYSGNVDVSGCNFQNAGSYGGNGYLISSQNANVTGSANLVGGTTDRYYNNVNATTGRFNVQFIGPYALGQTTGAVKGVLVGLDGSLNLYAADKISVVSSTTPIGNLQSLFLPGEEQVFYPQDDVANPTLIIMSSGIQTVPGGRRILRSGDTARVFRSDVDNKFHMTLAIAPLVGTAMPASGYYEAGEYVRNNASAGAAGAFVLGWQRITSGTNNVAGTDWRTISGTAA